jgi:hypothetical protein
MLATQIVLVPYPVPVPAAMGWLTKYPGHTPREGKTSPGWPLRQSIPTQETRRLLDLARRDIAERRERKAIAELLERTC